MSPGVWVVVAVLGAATVVGMLWRRSNGRMRDVADHTASGGVAAGDASLGGASDADVGHPALAGLGLEWNLPVTLVQFSSAFCAPCRATRLLCADVAARIPGVGHVEVDAEHHLDTVRALDIRRTPTVLVVDAAGRIVRRASGLPTRSQLMTAIADLV
ncbi:thiol reductase thioredoxin [Longispora fulva]|uniref:Thiol-disulfide isomerase/thioredoxin n=1 Tax=Longispora fulva TaxID=619741 RepID=A0A8J7GIR9_9ACTN|nr:thioredoxin family protein [Longispora fulva]MBG6138265.1 thiol-disulfide isomerase/thioredoxin [Longispora fulva]GIG60517.1 thiol reductase thioredoxin [Longispora fulva]